jgi:hypothetical protein
MIRTGSFVTLHGYHIVAVVVVLQSLFAESGVSILYVVGVKTWESSNY